MTEYKITSRRDGIVELRCGLRKYSQIDYLKIFQSEVGDVKMILEIATEQKGIIEENSKIKSIETKLKI
jgi:hypothetical protein